MSSRRSVLIHVAAAIALVAGVLVAVPASGRTAGGPGQANATTTPVQHVVVIYQENHSFDNYFGTYPNAANPPGEPVFHADAGTPTVNGLSDELLTDNPNLANRSAWTEARRSPAITTTATCQCSAPTTPGYWTDS